MVSTSFSRPSSRPTSRPVTPGRNSTAVETENPQLPPIPESRPQSRRMGLGGFLRRSKSSELGTLSGSPKSTGAKLSRKRSAREKEEFLRRQRELSASPPRLPEIYNGLPPSSLQTFGGDGAGPDTYSTIGSNRATRPPRASIDTFASNAPNNIPIPPIPGDAPRSRGGSYVPDPYARTESMTHRGRYSYASSAISTINSPRKVRRRKDPTPFNVLVIGARNSGKTSFLNFLKSSLALPKRKGHIKVEEGLPQMSANQSGNSAFESQYLETEIDGERIGLTLWDSQGFEKGMVDLQLREMSAFLESKFEDTFSEENKVIRSPGVQDTHIHCVFLLLDPVRVEANIQAAKSTRNKMNGGAPQHQQARIVGGLDEDLDLQVLRTLQGKTTVVPVISKADAITSAHMKSLKRVVWDSLKKANLDPLEALGLDPTENDDIEEEDEDADEAGNSSDSSMLIKQSNTTGAKPATPTGKETTSASGSPAKASSDGSPKSARGLTQTNNTASDETPYLPLSIISPDSYDPGTIGRKFPWGFADPYDAEHCDFVRLKEAVFNEWRGELREASRELWYEGWRTSRLKKHRKAK